jgi:hypothetical protein
MVSLHKATSLFSFGLMQLLGNLQLESILANHVQIYDVFLNTILQIMLDTGLYNFRQRNY